MEMLKSFFTGILVIIASFLLFGLILFTWPVLVGISSLFLSFLAIIFFIVAVFYIIALVGYIARQFLKK
ncbi:MAG: hypothetical protein ABIH74_04035 [Candidatus Omnitrophota bacterium]